MAKLVLKNGNKVIENILENPGIGLLVWKARQMKKNSFPFQFQFLKFIIIEDSGKEFEVDNKK